MLTQTHSPEACRQKAAMLRYAEWWMRLAEIRDSPSVLLGVSDIGSD